MTSTQKKFGLGAAAVILLAIAFYFFYWIKTPAYSLNIIRESVQKHDVVTFEKHVDLDSVYNKAFDDAIVAMDKIEGKGTLSNPMAAGFLQMMKPAVVTAFKTKTLDAVKGTDAASGDGSNADKITESLQKRANIEDAAIKNISTVSKENQEAVVSVVFHDNKLDKDFELKLKMTALDDGTWKVKEITNLTDYLVEEDKAEKAKLAELNKPIKEELEKAVTIQNGPLTVESDGNPYFASHTAKFHASFKNNSGKEISEFTVKVSILDNENRVRSQDVEHVSNKPLPSGQTMTLDSNQRLNPFMDPDKDMISRPKNFKKVAELTEIKYSDGQEIKLLDQVPSPSKK